MRPFLLRSFLSPSCFLEIFILKTWNGINKENIAKERVQSRMQSRVKVERVTAKGKLTNKSTSPAIKVFIFKTKSHWANSHNAF